MGIVYDLVIHFHPTALYHIILLSDQHFFLPQNLMHIEVLFYYRTKPHNFSAENVPKALVANDHSSLRMSVTHYHTGGSEQMVAEFNSNTFSITGRL